MPVVVAEKFGSPTLGSGAGASAERLYVIFGTADEFVAKAELAIAAPTTFDILPRQTVQVAPVANDVWEGTVRYGFSGSTAPPATGDSVFSFDTSGGTQHITHSKQTVAAYIPPGFTTTPDFQGAIGVTADSVEGVDITVPVYAFSETHYLADSLVTLAYRGLLFSLTGKVNNAAFKGTATGECLFLGASGSKRVPPDGGTPDWEINFRFAASPNMTGLVIGPITGIAKKGWEYLWVRYEDTEDATAKLLVKRPRAVYVERVYDPGNFALLGIGT